MRHVLLCLVFCFPLVRALHAAEKLTTVNYSEGAASLETFIEIYGPAASAELAVKWESLINNTWNKALAEHGCACLTIVVKANVRYRGATNSSEVESGWEAWEVRTREEWDQTEEDWHPYVDFPSGTDDRFDGQVGTGQLPTDEPWVVVHESAHFFGHGDQYLRDPKTGEIIRDENGDVKAEPGWEQDNIMVGPKIDDDIWNNHADDLFGPENYQEISGAVHRHLSKKNSWLPGQFFIAELEFDFHQNSWGPGGPAAGMNSEHGTAKLSFCIGFSHSAATTLVGQGTLSWEPASRIPETKFGGHRAINNPFPVRVTGEMQEDKDGFSVYFVTIDPADDSEAFLINGRVYANGSHLDWLLPNAKCQDKDVLGTLRAFQLPTLPKNEYHFEIETPVNQNVQSRGTAVLTLRDGCE